MTAVCVYLLAINAAAFCAFALDKYKAVHGMWRIREATLLGLSFLGGAAGGYAAMLLFRHKTRKVRFAVGVPLMLAVQAVLLLVWLVK